MGMFTIVVHGVGAHHNENNKGDANRMVARFVKELQWAGHNVEGATITYGGREDAMQLHPLDHPAVAPLHREIAKLGQPTEAQQAQQVQRMAMGDSNEKSRG